MSDPSLTVALDAADLMRRLGLSPRQRLLAGDAADRVLAAARGWMDDAVAGGVPAGEAARLMGCGLAVALKIDGELAKERDAIRGAKVVP